MKDIKSKRLTNKCLNEREIALLKFNELDTEQKNILSLHIKNCNKCKNKFENYSKIISKLENNKQIIEKYTNKISNQTSKNFINTKIFKMVFAISITIILVNINFVIYHLLSSNENDKNGDTLYLLEKELLYFENIEQALIGGDEYE
ncbi:MAG: hypothetical protein RMJ36_01955 [Candidatus Calescibacterium sp.]|nr:hypothetical protein [Candidatus Calescibacterium sp.]MDW8132403.1 hypothetical protein [Candidatus Calescibacterium sp.]